MQAEPRAAHRPHAGLHAIDGDGIPPNVGVVMEHEAARAVEISSDAPAVLTRLIDQVEQRLVHFLKIGNLGGPVIHLGIDVDGVLAVPGRGKLIVPEALERRSHRAGAAARDQQVAAELKIESGKRRVVRSALQAFICGEIGGGTAKLEVDAPEQSLVIRDVRGAKFGVGLSRGCEIAIEIPFAEAGAGGDEQRCGVGAFDDQLVAFSAHPAAFGDGS